MWLLDRRVHAAGAVGANQREGRVRRKAVLVLTLIMLAAAGCGPDADSAGHSPGARWTPSSAPPPLPGERVWAVGVPDLVLVSDDGGATWRTTHRASPERENPGSVPVLWGVTSCGPSHGWAVGATGILATSDGGTTWTLQHSDPRESLWAVACTDARHAWAVGWRRANVPSAVVLATTNGGSTWTRQRIGGDVRLRDVAFVDAAHGWVVGEDERGQGRVFVTTDGGQSWHAQLTVRQAEFSAVAVADARHAWVVGGTASVPASNDREYPPALILSTRNGGKVWTEQLSGVSNMLKDVFFADNSHGWSVGAGGALLATTDGGSSWVPQHVRQQVELAAVAFSDAANGWVAAERHGLLVTRDGGRTWAIVRLVDDGLLMGVTAVRLAPSQQPVP